MHLEAIKAERIVRINHTSDLEELDNEDISSNLVKKCDNFSASLNNLEDECP